MKILIKGGRVIDPSSNLDEVCDILTQDSVVAQVSKGIKTEADFTIEAADKIVMPGLIDMHVHLREPGREDKETVASGTRAALKGGITSVLAMPNTFPAMDSVEHVRSLKDIIKNSAQAHVLIAGAITRGRSGEELADIAAVKKEGVVAITDDGHSVDSDALMLEALKTAQAQGVLVICHSEDKKLTNKGVVNLGFTSTRMGLRGISKESEYKRVQRDIELAEKAGARVHIAHVSCQESLELIAAAKKKGIKVTCETAPHYFSLSEEDVLGFDTFMKMNPPLRSRQDVAAIREGLADGTIDAIASDHAPHTENEKDIEFERAEFGVVGLETMLAVSVTELVEKGVLTWLELARKLTVNPARILGLSKGTLKEGADADLTVVAPKEEWLAEKAALVSKSKNCAFLGRALKGVVEYAICSGRIAYPFKNNSKKKNR
ncbi:MAG: dihydroorotase [Candidatus Omnitrophota bacterium]